jgi:putative ABC transport system permease protein
LTSLRVNKVLIVFQFAASIILIVGTIVVFRQLQFMRETDLGMNIDQTLIVKGPAVKDSTYHSVLETFAHEAGAISGVVSFTVSSSIPGEEVQWGRSFARKDGPQNSAGAAIIAVDNNFFPSYDIEFLAGNNYPDQSVSYQDKIIVNETMARELGYSDAGTLVGQVLLWQEGNNQVPRTVIGVVRDFNQQSLRSPVGPIVFTLKKYVFAPWAGEFYSFKVDNSHTREAISGLEALWNHTFSANPFDYFFLDLYYDAQYKLDAQFGRVFLVFSILAVFIAGLGLFGLTAYMTATRTKEIGIRKVLGATSFQLVKLFTRNYVLLVIFSIVIACPVSIYLIEEWQQQFAYQVTITPWTYVSASGIALLTALLTVGIKSWNASLINPAQTLKTE